MDKKYYYFDEPKKMVLVNNFKDWLKDEHGEGDALWRTSIAYITYGEKRFKDGIIDAFKKNDDSDYYQARRCNPFYGTEDVSRDQVILAWTSLYMNNNIIKLADIVYNTKFRLSKRYLQTLTMWFWARGLVGNFFYGHIAQVLLTFELFFGVTLNQIIKFLIGWEEIPAEKLEKMLETQGEGVIRKQML